MRLLDRLRIFIEYLIRNRLAEESILFISILKWFVLATGIGAIVGFSTTIFLKALEGSIAYTSSFPFYFFLLPPAFFLSAWTIRRFAPDAEGHGTEKVIEAVHKRMGNIPLAVVPIKLLATVVTIASGGSAGKEGPCAQIGGGLASTLANGFRFDPHDRRKLVICGISAGFAAVFGTPIAGAIFGIEALFVGGLLYDVLLPSFIAGVVGFQVATAFGVSYFYHPLNFVPAFSETFFIKVALAGVFFGLCSFIFIEVLLWGKWVADRIRMRHHWKAFLGGLILVGLAFFLGKEYLGLGLGTIQQTLEGEAMPWYAFLYKMIFTSMTLNFGGSGGIVTPIFFIGSTAGTLFAQWMSLDPATFAAIGLVALLAGATNTPLAASILAVEMFGARIGPYAAVACVISFLMTGHRSVFPSQVVAIKKSASFDVELGKEIVGSKIIYQPRARGLLGALKWLSEIIRDRTDQIKRKYLRWPF